MSDQEYVESIVKPIVDNPADVVTSRTLDERGVLIQLSVNQADMGKVIGREGRTAKSIRSLLRVFGARNDARINLKIVDPSGGEVSISEEPKKSDKTEQATSVI
ncbi:KH domain-containing protein [Candidatus Berkelbacteria bacterium]|nr:KH domain-containing protein [Candidatus Berkelbacteria bacterium]